MALPVVAENKKGTLYRPNSCSVSKIPCSEGICRDRETAREARLRTAAPMPAPANLADHRIGDRHDGRSGAASPFNQKAIVRCKSAANAAKPHPRYATAD